MLPCPLYQLTGIQCPFCGTQRALLALCEGEWVAAWRFNPFFWISAPYLLLLLFGALSPHVVGQWKVTQWAYSNLAIACYLLLAILWAILRNTL